MNRIRQRINEIGNEKLNNWEVISFGFMVLGFLSVPIQQNIFQNLPKWIPIPLLVFAIGLMVVGNYNKREERNRSSNEANERTG